MLSKTFINFVGRHGVFWMLVLIDFFVLIFLPIMSSQIKEICNSIYQEQVQSIRDLTSGHLNENHLYRPSAPTKGSRKPTWSASQKPRPTLRPSHRLTTSTTNVEQMKDTLVDFTYLTLPELSQKKISKPKQLDETQTPSSSSDSNDRLPPINNERLPIPTFVIDLSDEQRMRKMKTFNETVLQKKDVNLHGLGYSEDFVSFVEQNLLMKLALIESQFKHQVVSLTRLQAYGDAMSQLIEGSIAFGPVLERIKNEYELYLDHLLTTQPEFGSHIAEQLKRLRQAKPRFSTAENELFDIDKLEMQVRQGLKRNRHLQDELERAKHRQVEVQRAATARATEISAAPTELKIKTQAEQIEDRRQNIFELLDRMTKTKEELAEKYVPMSVCTQLQLAIRDTEMDTVKTNQQNEKLSDEIASLEERLRREIVSHDSSEFADENVDQIIRLLKKVELLHMNKSAMSGEEDNDDRYFLHTYDDYFS